MEAPFVTDHGQSSTPRNPADDKLCRSSLFSTSQLVLIQKTNIMTTVYRLMERKILTGTHLVAGCHFCTALRQVAHLFFRNDFLPHPAGGPALPALRRAPTTVVRYVGSPRIFWC